MKGTGINMKKNFLFITLLISSIFLFSSCQQVDIVGKTSITSFSKILDAIPASVTADEMNNGWSLSAPDESARFIWSKDFSQSPTHDVMLEFDAKPFIEAGLDVTKLPDGMAYADKIMVGTKLGNEKLKYDKDATPLSSYEQIVDLKRSSVKYHAELDHYGVDLADGNMFEWAKDMSTNDKDIVFVLNPKVFIDAGVDTAKLKGWVYAKVPMMDKDGKPIKVDKFLKPFDLK